MSFVGRRTWAWIYALIGVILALEAVHHVLFEPHLVPLYHVVAYASILFLGSAVLLIGAYRHHQEPLPAQRYWRINLWVVVAGVFVTAIGVLSLYIGSQRVTGGELTDSIQLLLGAGFAIGFLIGTFEAQSLEHAEAAARADTLEAERERFQLLNELLRHYVLNGVSVIDGYAGKLEASTSGAQKDSVAVIRERAADMENIVSNIGVLMTTEWGDGTEVEADLAGSIKENFSQFCDEDMTLALPEDTPPMVANRGYEEAMALFVEGICKATEADGTVTVEWNQDQDEGSITVEVGPLAIPESLREDLLEPIESGIGLELFLAKKVLEPAVELEISPQGEETIECILRGEFVEPNS